MDANFQNQLKIKTKSDPDDVSLFNGRCFYPDEAEFKKYLSAVTDTDEVPGRLTLAGVTILILTFYRRVTVQNSKW